MRNERVGGLDSNYFYNNHAGGNSITAMGLLSQIWMRKIPTIYADFLVWVGFMISIVTINYL
jgi:hypothetical protein